METSVKAAEMLLSPQPSETTSLDPEGLECEAVASSSSSSSSHTFDPIQEFSQRLEDIISDHGSAAVLLDTQSVIETEMEKMDTVTLETDISAIRHCLDSLPSPEDKLEELVHKHAELAAQRRKDEQRLNSQQLQLGVLMEQRCSGLEARRKLEDLCRELQSHYSNLREEALQRSREDEEKRKEITSSFQEMLTEIQEQIHLHSARNDKLCRENSNLTDKLESLMNQCERREESLEKIGQHRDLQQKLTEAKLQQANALLAEAEDRHKREKEYLLREAIDKTKKCFAMKEQELSMKKKLLVQAADWKVQAQTLREQGTVMQAQLTLYGQKFDEFQATLAKSNEIYVRFKKEMDNMSQKMKKMEKESDLWKMRFENCNKALTDMIEERTEKGKEYDMFVLKIHKLEKLCRALQYERKVLYDKIKEVRHSNASLPLKVSGLVKGSEECTLLTSKEILDLEEEDPVLTEDMVRLREEQAKLQDFATALLDLPEDDEEQEDKSDPYLEKDLVVSSFVQFKTKSLDKEGSEEVQNPAEPPPEPLEPEETSSDSVLTHPDLVLQTPAETQPPNRAEPGPEPEPEALKLEVLKEDVEAKPVLPVEDEKTQQQRPSEPAQVPIEQTPPPPATSSNKQVAKKKKRSSKTLS